MNVLLATPAPLPLHSLPAWVDISAMAVAAAFGAATGRNRRLPLLGVLIAGVISGLVGGMIRDALLGLEAAAIENCTTSQRSSWPHWPGDSLHIDSSKDMFHTCW